MRHATWAAFCLSASLSGIAWGSPAQQTTNPATLTTAGSGTRWEVGILTGQVDADFRRDAAAGVAAAGRYSAETVHPVLPFFAFSHALNDTVTLGFALDTPSYFDLRWEDHAYDVNVGGNRLDLTKGGRLIARRVGPAAAWRLGDHWSTGVRLFAQRVDAAEDSDFAKVAGHGTTYGLQLGARYIGRGYLAGAAFTTRTNTDVRGSQTEVHPLLAASGALVAGEARADILLPARLHGNFALALRADLWTELELEWFDWSYVDERTIYQANGTIVNQGKNARHYHDTINTRLGIKWQRTPGAALYGAIGYEPTQVPDQDVTPAQTFLDRTRLTLGSAWKLERGWTVDLMYQYAHGHTRTVQATDQDNTASGADTRVYEGTYRSRSHSLRLSVTGTF